MRELLEKIAQFEKMATSNELFEIIKNYDGDIAEALEDFVLAIGTVAYNTPDKKDILIKQAKLIRRLIPQLREFRLLQRSGVSKAELHQFLTQESFAHRVNLTKGEPTAASPEELSSAVTLNGEPHLYAELF